MMGAGAVGAGGGGILSQLFSDPNFLKYLGGAGAALSQGEPVGVALNPAGLISGGQEQQAGAQLMQQLLNPQGGQQMGQQMRPTAGETPRIGDLQVTPDNTPGYNAVTQKITDKGTVTTLESPNLQRSSSMGSNLPAEALSSGGGMGGGGRGMAPFFKALLSQ